MNPASCHSWINRRDFIAFSAAAPYFLTGVTGTGELRAAISPAKTPIAGILVFLTGGPSHLDTFDPKPSAPSEIRGDFKAVATKVPGLQICEHLPKLAQCADHFSLLRGVSHTLAAHSLGSQYLNTGSRPLASLKYPSYGSVVTKERGSAEGVPNYVAVPHPIHDAGFLGMRYNAFSAAGMPTLRRPIPVRGVTLPPTLPLAEFDRRYELLTELDRRFSSMADDGDLTAMDDFSRQTHAMIRSPKTREAFDLSRESPSFARRFGDDDWSGSCLLAIRLVEAGVGFVTLSLGGWDTHASNFPTLKDRLLPKLDLALSGLFTGLSDRGLLASTAVLVTGEFGRTPKINSNPSPGRDHYPGCMSVLMAGNLVRGGQLLGASDATGSRPEGRRFSPDDVAATFYRNLAIDPATVYQSDSGRPITLVRNGQSIDQLLG